MKIRSIILGTLLPAALLTTPALAHTDPRNDGFNDSTRRCDTYYRPGHAPTTGPNGTAIPENQRRSDHHTSEFDQGQIGPAYIHNHPGHYVARGDDFYIEVVGGGGYNRDGNQGGWVQGEVDRSEIPADVDFHANAFAGTAGPMHSEAACLSVSDTRVGDPGSRPALRIEDGHRGHMHPLPAPGMPMRTVTVRSAVDPLPARRSQLLVNAVALLA